MKIKKTINNVTLTAKEDGRMSIMLTPIPYLIGEVIKRNGKEYLVTHIQEAPPYEDFKR